MNRLILNIGITFALLATFGNAYAYDVPTYDGFVTDKASVLQTEDIASLNEKLSTYRAETSNEIAILIIPTLNGESAADVAVQIGRSWGVGGKQKDNGVLMLVAIDDREIFIATGYGLEGALPDIVTKGIIDGEIFPLFRDKLYYEGIAAGIDAMQKHIGGEYTADRYGSPGDDSPLLPLLFFAFIFLEFLGAYLARSKSWWLGGFIGAILGIIVSLVIISWVPIIMLTIFGFIFDFIVSKTGIRNFGGPRIGGGGFGGFGGGSFGGGGAGGKW